MKKTKVKGFTLIELLIASSLVVVIGGALFFSFSQGLKLWGYGVRSEPLARTDFALDRLKSDLRNSFADSNDPFIGTGDQLEFFTEAWQVPREDTKKGEDFYLPRPIRVRYAFDRAAQKWLRGEESYDRLLTTALKKDRPVPSELMGSIREVSFEYYGGRDRQGGRKWLREWRQKCFPEAVKVTIRYNQMNQDLVTEEMIQLPVKNCPQPKQG